jgi:hypothetical protein
MLRDVIRPIFAPSVKSSRGTFKEMQHVAGKCIGSSVEIG